MAEDGTWGGIDAIMYIYAFLPIILYIIIPVIAIYFVVKVIKFMGMKTKLDQERNAKLDELIGIMRREKDGGGS